MYRIRRFGVVSTANVFAILYALITLIFVIPFALILAAGPVTTTDAFGNRTQVGISPLFLLLIPVLYGVLGWIFTAIFCLLYNLSSRFVGGIEVEVDGPPAAVAAPVTAPPA
jgi:glycopeptide antibiotics resistance protein